MRRVAAAMVADVTDYVELEDVSHSVYEEKVEETDPFKDKVVPSKQSSRVKSKYYRLEKKYGAGKDGTETKFEDPEQLSAYGMFDVVEPPYNLDILASLFEENAIHYACIMARTMNTVGLGYDWEDTPKAKKTLERAAKKDGEDSSNRARDALERETERLDEIFDGFNQEESFTETMIKVWIDVLATGNGYIEIARNNKGEIGYVGHIPSKYLRIRRMRDGYVQRNGHRYVYFRNYGDDTADPINGDPKPNEIIHFYLYTPTNTYYGVPSAVAALSAIIGDKFAKEYNIDYFENKSIPRYAIILKGAKLSNKSKQEVVNYFKNEIKGNNHGTLFIPLPATLGKDVDIKFEKLETQTQESSFDKYRKANRDEIMIAHRVPAPKIGVYDNANLAVSRDADKTFKIQVIGPDQSVVEKKINRIVKEFSDKKSFKFAQIDIIDDDIRSRIWDRYLRTTVVTPNEVRTKIGLTPIEGGDDYLPYPTQVQAEKLGLRVLDYDERPLRENEKPQMAPGAPEGNANGNSANPPKSGQDATDRQGSAVDQVEGRADRGAKMDEGGNN